MTNYFTPRIGDSRNCPPPPQIAVNEAVRRSVFNIGKQVFLFTLMLLSCLSARPLIAETTSPCECSSFLTIGTTGGTTDYRDIDAFGSARCYFVKGKLVVTDATWSGIRVKMEEGAQIFVTSGAGLTLVDCYISGCGEMWRGINVDYTTNINVYNSVIEDAEIGIRLRSYDGVHCEYTSFINDYIGIGVGTPLEEDEYDAQIQQKGDIIGCEFYTDGSLPDPYPAQSPFPAQYYYPSWPTTPAEIPYNQGYAAIYIFGATGMHLGRVDAETEERNDIHDMRNGIIVRYSDFDIAGTDIHDLEGTQPNRPPDPVLDLNQYGIYEFDAGSTITENVLDNLLVGIFTDESFSTIVDNDITLVNTGPAITKTRGVFAYRPQSLGVKLNSITDGYFGIFVANANTPFDIVNNTLQRDVLSGGNAGINAIGVLQAGPNLGKIRSNVINIEDGHNAYGIYLNNNQYTSAGPNYIYFLDDVSVGDKNTGFEVSGSTYSSIRKNHVYADGVYQDNDDNFGINLEGSQLNTYFCNDIYNFNIDIRVFGPNMLTQLMSNQIYDGDYGLDLVGYVSMGKQFQNNNLWIGDYDVCGANINYDGDPTDIALLNPFYYDPDVTFSLPPSICPESVDMGNWFISNEYEGPAPVDCFSDIDNPVADPDTIAKIVRTPLDFEEFNDELTWMMKADIYELMLLDTDLHDNTVLDSFFDAEESNPLGKLVTWQLQLSSRFGTDDVEKSLTQDTIDLLSTDLADIDGYLSTSPSDSTTWMALRALKVDTLSDKLGYWLDLLDDENDESLSAFADISDSLDNLTASNDIEEYLREALYFKAQYLLGEELSSGDSSDIFDLTQLCPWEGGRAVYIAQELYALIADTIVSVTLDNCSSPEPFQVNPGNDSLTDGWNVTSFPNPTNDHVQISSVEDIKRVIVSNTSRKQLYSLEPKKQNCTVDLSSYPDGIYIISVFTDSGLTAKRILLVR